MRKFFASAVVAALLLVTAWPAQAAGARVQATPGTADPDYATVLTVRGTGFQSVPKGYGGIYLLFGWVDGGAWQPSKGGASGATYRYVPDKEAKDNRGFQRFVSFPGSDTAGSANGGEIAADGSWSTQLTVPGARFKSTDRDGKVVDVDCLKVQCGLITVGAHGVVNANNETFTPISFVVPKKAVAPPPPPPATTSSAAPPSSTVVPSTTVAPSTVEPVPSAQPVVQPAAQASSTPWWLFGAVAAVVLLAAIGVPLVLRRRRRNPEQEGTES